MNASVWWQYLFPAAVVALGATLWLVRDRSRAPLAAFLFFAGSLFPVLGFFNVYPFVFSFVADHFQYLASVGIIALVAATAATLWTRVPEPARKAGPALAVLLVGTLGALTFRQSGIYRDAFTLYRLTLEKNPGCWMCSNNIGMVLSDSGKPQAAIPYYEHTLRIRPNLPETHNNLANALLQTGRAAESIGYYREALRLKPSYFEAHNNLGAALFNLGKTSEAKAEYEAALRINPDFEAARENLSLVAPRPPQAGTTK
jgi:tetratricopeptide (TPR) repeat protein